MWKKAALLGAMAFLSPMAALAATDTADIVARSDIALGQPNVLPIQAVGLGNGRLGAAFWAADGLTLQLNRSDTLPYRRSPGQVSFPDLQPLIADRGFNGRVNLHDGVLEEHGGGITLKAWIDHASDRVVIDLSGLAPDSTQHIRLHLWEPRTPVASTHADVALLAQSWLDDSLPGASGQRFGSLAAIKAIGRDAKSRVIDARSVEVAVRPTADGHLRVLIAAPAFNGDRPAADVANATLATPVDPAAGASWWHAFWSRALPIRAESSDGVARYAETLRTLFLFASAAHESGSIPGSQGGMADLFSSSGDDHFWDPAAFWFWNLRMQVGAHLAAGVPELNAPVFALYRDHLDEIRRWTQKHMDGHTGICVPETMRFNGNGVEYESDRFRPFAIVTHSCDLGWSASSNARTLSSGAEIGLWVWRTYLQTRDPHFLQANYALIADAARFLLDYQKPDTDGLLHTSPSNAHETQMDVTDPTTDLAAIHALYPVAIAAANTLQRDAPLVSQLEAALRKTPPLPVVAASAVASPSTAAKSGDTVIASSYVPASPYRNGENIGLEAVWPYELIGIDDPLFAVARRTYALRPFVYQATWSYDPVQAAQLGLGDEVANALFQIVQLYQVYPNGMSALIEGPPHEFYIEQAGITALTLSQVLAIENDDGLIRIGPAIPAGWTMDGAVALRDGASVEVQAVDGRVTSFVLHDPSGSPVRIAMPWEGRKVRVLHQGQPPEIIDGGRYAFHPAPGDYRFEPVGESASPHFASEPSPTIKSLGRASIGLGSPCCAPPPGYDILKDKP
ncbi:glycoside hydrolase [Rhodanobacter sp. L36]|uniref:glycosyl hydrolase family 95 catalytic domain-containing protein n=1 Tax=Rhodanobacter sp. L36 TaxID=1747221 RepID=UPI00131B8F7C|nr:glycoside hydrolase [Rhodanobacter sp. L36]